MINFQVSKSIPHIIFSYFTMILKVRDITWSSAAPYHFVNINLFAAEAFREMNFEFKVFSMGHLYKRHIPTISKWLPELSKVTGTLQSFLTNTLRQTCTMIERNDQIMQHFYVVCRKWHPEQKEHFPNHWAFIRCQIIKAEKAVILSL